MFDGGASIKQYLRAESVELLLRGGEPEVAVVGEHFERVRAFREGVLLARQEPGAHRICGRRRRKAQEIEIGERLYPLARALTAYCTGNEQREHCQHVTGHDD